MAVMYPSTVKYWNIEIQMGQHWQWWAARNYPVRNCYQQHSQHKNWSTVFTTIFLVFSKVIPLLWQHLLASFLPFYCPSDNDRDGLPALIDLYNPPGVLGQLFHIFFSFFFFFMKTIYIIYLNYVYLFRNVLLIFLSWTDQHITKQTSRFLQLKSPD